MKIDALFIRVKGGDKVAIVTLQLCEYLMDRNNAWFQIIDDVNSINVNNVRNIANDSVIIAKDRITRAISKDIYKIGSDSSIKDNIMQYALDYCTFNNLNESLKINLLANFTHFINVDFKK